MKVLVTGANGFLGIHLVNRLLARGYEVMATGTKNPSLLNPHTALHYRVMDFTDPFAVHDVFEDHAPGIVIHAGALSQPDMAEQEQWKAYTVNVQGTLNLLANAEPLQAFFIFISTDFVFDGEKGSYGEDQEKAPVNFYGKTKADAEDAVAEYSGDWAIVRTSLVYGKPLGGKPNILSLVKNKLEKGEEYGLVSDQFRSPTYVEDLVEGILLIMEKKATGIFHLAGKEVLSPFQMGKAAAAFLGKDPALFKELTAASFSQPAKRPAKTSLLIEKAVKELGYSPHSFSEGMRETFS
jgi:dTDP-4-dehydrorhamnose reductase